MGILEFDLIDPTREFIHAGRVTSEITRTYADISLENGETIPGGSLVGQLHFTVPLGESERLQSLSKAERARKVASDALDGLVLLAQKCQDKTARASEVSAFVGRSNLIKPHVFKGLGFTISPYAMSSRAKRGISSIHSNKISRLARNDKSCVT